MYTLRSVVALLHRYHQRTTYKAMAGLLGKEPHSVLQGSPRNYEFSWVVNQDTGEPGGYPEGMVHPALRENPTILASADELAAWLGEHA